MNSVAKKEKNFKSKGTKSQIKSILKTLVALNKDKTLPEIKYILISQVESRIIKMLKRYNRLLKIYWTIETKNKNYIQSGGVEEYSASDIYNIVNKLLEHDAQKKVCKRTIERDIKLLNEMGLLKSKIRKFGKQKGSIAHYIQNMEFTHIHKDIILEYLKHLLKEDLKDRKIIGDFNKDMDNTTFNYTNLKRFEILSKLNEHNKTNVMSHVKKSHVINKANISYKIKENSKEMLSTRIDSSNKKTRQYKLKKKDVETRLVFSHKISKEYLKQVKEYSNNDSTYINALLNLEVAIIEYRGEYNIEDMLEHFLKQFRSRYKNKIWMMMRRKDGVISDYKIIWEGRFRDLYSNKYKFDCCFAKESYSETIQVRSMVFSAEKIEKEISNNLKNEDTERIERERKKKSKLKLKRREEYLKKLFEREARERKERLRKAKEEQDYLRYRARESMFDTLEKKRGKEW
ncbi:plasmid maintenance protein [Borrelia miyamotoi]|uniref:plasmid maintenance protein n=1 Tax=Borrelia miyamotoi TaxID=47466 RepID=UPI0031FF1670